MTTPASRRRRGLSEDDPWGWFEEIERTPSFAEEQDKGASMLQKALSVPGANTEVPPYILEEPLDSQQLWHMTAGRRPRQPTPEREAFEKMLEQNFRNSEIDYSRSPSVTADKPLQPGDIEVLEKGVSPFGTAVSKSFYGSDVPVITLQLPKFRVVRRAGDGEEYAEFLVVVSLGSVTYGVWKRHTHFKELAEAIERTRPKQFRNTVLSWKCLLQRQRWFRCLEMDYLALKCFLLERFMHDLLFETTSPRLITDFLIEQEQ